MQASQSDSDIGHQAFLVCHHEHLAIGAAAHAFAQAAVELYLLPEDSDKPLPSLRRTTPLPRGYGHGATHAPPSDARCHPVSTHTFDCSRLSLVRHNSQSAVRVFLSWRGTLPAMAYLPDLPLHESHRCDTCATERCLRSQAGGFHLSSYRPNV